MFIPDMSHSLGTMVHMAHAASTDTGEPPTEVRRGRTQSQARTQAILDATHEALLDSGWDRLRMQDVADRAGAGLSTIYRRWPTKEHLVAAALADRAHIEIEPSDDPRTDLDHALDAILAAFGPASEIIVGVLAAARDSETLGNAIQTALQDSIRPLLTRPLLKLGLTHAEVDTVADAALGLMLLRSAVARTAIDHDTYVEEVNRLVDLACRREPPAR